MNSNIERTNASANANTNANANANDYANYNANDYANEIAKIIDTRLANVRVRRELKEAIMGAATAEGKKTGWRLEKTARLKPAAAARLKPATAARLKPAAAALFACICLAIAVPVLAMVMPSFLALLQRVGPVVGGQLQPINLVSEDDGIVMEVVAATNDDDTASIYLTLLDATGARIDRSIELYGFQVKCDGVYLPGTSELVAYDDETDTATIMITAKTAGATDTLNGKKLTLYLNSFLSGKQELDDVDTGIDLSLVTDKANTTTCDVGGRGISASSSKKLESELESREKINILKPDELDIPIPGIDFARISNIGIVDGRLHVQVRTDRSLSAMNATGYAALVADSLEAVKGNDYFTMESDNYIHIPRAGISFFVDENGQVNRDADNWAFEYSDDRYRNRFEEGRTYPEYSETIYDASLDMLSDCRLVAAWFSAYRNHVACDLRSTFETSAPEEPLSAACDIDLGGVRLRNVTLSPFGISVTGDADEAYLTTIAVSIELADGSTVLLSEARVERKVDANGSAQSWSPLAINDNIMTSAGSGEDGAFWAKYTCKIPLDASKISSVTINGNTVVIKA